MTSPLIPALVALLFFVCGLRTAGSEARTASQMWGALASWRGLGTAARVTGVLVLLILVDACHMLWHIVQGAGFVLKMLAYHLEQVGRRVEVAA